MSLLNGSQSHCWLDMDRRSTCFPKYLIVSLMLPIFISVDMPSHAIYVFGFTPSDMSKLEMKRVIFFFGVLQYHFCMHSYIFCLLELVRLLLSILGCLALKLSINIHPLGVRGRIPLH